MALLQLPLLYPNDVPSLRIFRLVSKACRRESDRLLHRTSTITDKTQQATAHSQHILHRLQSPSDELSQQIHHLTIGPFSNDDLYITKIAPFLHRALPALTALKTLHYISPYPFPPNTHKSLLTANPDLNIHYTNTARKWPHPLHRALLSSPHLHTLDICLYYIYPLSCSRDPVPPYSEFQILKAWLIAGRSLKCLRISTTSAQQGVPIQQDTASDPRYALQNWDGVVAGPLNFCWGKDGSFTFPALEELSVAYQSYKFDKRQCEGWIGAMDWSQLRRLDLGEGAPGALLQALTGRVAGLRSLKCGIWFPYDPVHYPERSLWGCRDWGVLGDFLASIEELEELRLNVYDYEDFKRTLIPVVLGSVGGSLRELRVSCLGWDSKRWKKERFKEVLGLCPRLEELDLELRWQHAVGRWEGEGFKGSVEDQWEAVVVREKVVNERRKGYDFRGQSDARRRSGR